MAAEKVRNPVAQGGMWNSPKAQYSKETQNLLKEMMRESKLTNFQQRQLDKTMKDGSSLPRACHPTSSAKPKVVGPPTKKDNSLVIDPKKYNPTVRTQDKIESTGAYEREKFQPSPQIKYGGFYEKDKRRLANIMAYGEDLPPPNKSKKPVRPRREQEEPNVDRFDELQAEIEERRSFMDKMESIGQAEKHRTVINTEISRLIREMEVIDRKRSEELQKAIDADEKRRKQYSDIPKPDVS